MIKARVPGMSEAIMVFNFLPAAYAHPSWIDAPESLLGRLGGLQAPAARQVLSKWLLERHDAAGSFDFDFSHIEKALFLQDSASLLRLAAVTGLLRHREKVRKMAAGGVLQRLATEFGHDSAEWVLARLPDADFLPPVSCEIDYDADALIPQFAACGIPWLIGLVLPEWKAVAVRARLKFARGLQFLPPVIFGEEARHAGISYMKKHLFEEGALWA